MGSASSAPLATVPSTMNEKSSSGAESSRRRTTTTDAQQLLAQLSLGGSSKSKPATAMMSIDSLRSWEKAFESNPKHKLAATFMHKNDFQTAMVQRKAVVSDQQVFNVTLSSENSTVANQKSSGRCWCFALCNVIRLAMQRKYNLEEFELSQSYLFFYDSLAKANWFLEQMLDLAEEDLDDRTVQYLMQAPENDGGQWDMAVNLVEHFGLVPQTVYPESFNSSSTGKLDDLLTSKLREYALELRELHANAMDCLGDITTKSHGEKKALAAQSSRKRKEEQMEEIYRILAITLGTPPKPDEEFTWEYYDTKKKYHSVTSTPKSFAKDYALVDVSKAISLIHDPRNAPGLYTVDRLGNVVGGRPVLYVNTEIEDLKNVAIKLLKNDTPVWFGCDVGKSSNTPLGLMDTKLFDLEEAFSTSLGMTKAQRLSTGDSAMTHAMVLTAVHLDANGKPVRWRVENSWSKEACTKGYMLMTDEWFTEHVFQVVADRSMVPKELVKVFEDDNRTVLPPWDPMGALA
ncbi:BZ3500_MvSof-1268-A1-R1_Chr1-1g01121 [Microbotryum saponariae]|uniref:Cysteine proteinase 1, mitochondrial n=1 Tax=Microbotryum saponariae TaxID=289078 RepID=A0A2X0KF62_9BASI|nr:BZ3500_MvSof-1268-A1-R1_Chr1-1g01121 [Microbotryum saponariae]SCZ93430.1 BZ3501_MvSof-1269-A2-R1_Chr1-1g00718 [Microbotryum saponariae]